MTADHAYGYEMPAEDAHAAASAAADGKVVYLTDRAGRRMAAVVPTEVADAALVREAAALNRQRLTALNEAAAAAGPLDHDEADVELLHVEQPTAGEYRRALRVQGVPEDQAADEAERLAARAVDLLARHAR